MNRRINQEHTHCRPGTFFGTMYEPKWKSTVYRAYNKKREEDEPGLKKKLMTNLDAYKSVAASC